MQREQFETPLFEYYHLVGANRESKKWARAKLGFDKNNFMLSQATPSGEI